VRMWILLVIVIVGVAAFIIGSWGFSRNAAPATGTLAPDFSLSSQDGSQVSLGHYRGKWIVLYFYPKDFTSGCTIEARNFQRDQAEYVRRNAAVLGVSVDSAESHRNFCGKEGLNFKLLADTSGRVAKQYGSLVNLGFGALAARHTFLIDPQGKIAQSFMSVSPSRHSAEVLAAVDQLTALGGAAISR